MEDEGLGKGRLACQTLKAFKTENFRVKYETWEYMKTPEKKQMNWIYFTNRL